MLVRQRRLLAAGQPDALYLGGSYDYDNAGVPVLGGDAGKRTNGRAFIYSTDAGANFSDLTRDACPAGSQDGMHPDQHAIAISPTNPNIVFFGSDGGVMRSSGDYADISAQCDSRGLNAVDLADCKQLLSRVPTSFDNLNGGLPTLQFQSLSVDPRDPRSLQGGTQDNGTWVGFCGDQSWNQTIWGDGGQSGFNAADSQPALQHVHGTGERCELPRWRPLQVGRDHGRHRFEPRGRAVLPAGIADPNPATAGSIYQGSQSIWRTQDWGGDRDFLEAHCSEFTTSSADTSCGDFERIGPAGATDLTAASYGTRAGSNVVAIERAASDTGTLWAATGTGRLFVSKNANAAAGSVTYSRIDLPTTPGRFISGIYFDPTNANHAWITYSGFSANTPAQPGHVFSVVFNPGREPRRSRRSTGPGQRRIRTSRRPTSLRTRTAISTCRTTSASCCCRAARRTGRSPVTACRASRSPA